MKRLADIADARFEIDEALNAPAPVAVIGSSAPLPRWRRALPWTIAGLALFSTAVTLSLWAPWRARAEAPLVRVTGDIGADVSVTGQGAVALSPDGTTLAFIAREPGDDSGIAATQLYIRRLDRLDATPVPGTTPAASPFFSPDGQWIGFASSGVLKKVSVSGGAVVTVTEAPLFRGGSWGEDDTIVFSSQREGGAVMRVPAAGGEPQKLTTPSQTEVFGHFTPQMLPNGRGILDATPPDPGAFNDATIMVLPLPTGEPMLLQRGGYYPRYLSSGHLTWVRDGTLFAATLDSASLQVTGRAVPVQAGLVGPVNGSALVSVSTEAPLAYLPNEAAGGPAQGPMLWLDRSGATRALRATPAVWGTPRFSPDGGRLALTVSDGRQADIWIYDIERDTLTRLTSDPARRSRLSGHPTAPESPTGRIAEVAYRICTGSVPTEPAPSSVSPIDPQRPTPRWVPSWRPVSRLSSGQPTTARPEHSDPCRLTAARRLVGNPASRKSFVGAVASCRSPRFRPMAGGWPTPPWNRGSRRSTSSRSPRGAGGGRCRATAAICRCGRARGGNCSLRHPPGRQPPGRNG